MSETLSHMISRGDVDHGDCYRGVSSRSTGVNARWLLIPRNLQNSGSLVDGVVVTSRHNILSSDWKFDIKTYRSSSEYESNLVEIT